MDAPPQSQPALSLGRDQPLNARLSAPRVPYGINAKQRNGDAGWDRQEVGAPFHRRIWLADERLDVPRGPPLGADPLDCGYIADALGGSQLADGEERTGTGGSTSRFVDCTMGSDHLATTPFVGVVPDL